MLIDSKRKCIMNYVYFKLEEEYKYVKFDFIIIYIFFILLVILIIM